MDTTNSDSTGQYEPASTTRLRDYEQLSPPGTRIGVVFENFRTLLTKSPPHLILPWVLTVIIDFFFVGLAISSALVLGAVQPWHTDTWAASPLQGFISLAQFVFVYTLRIALYRPIRALFFGQIGGRGDGVRIFKMALPQFVPVLLINITVAAIVIIGALFCLVPGLIAAFFLAFAPYLVATRDYGVVRALKSSILLVSRYWLLLLTAIVVAMVVFMLLGCVSFGSAGLTTIGVERLVVPISMLGSWGVHAVLGFFAWLYWGALFVTVDAMEEKRHSSTGN